MGNFFNQLDSHLSNQTNPLRADQSSQMKQEQQSPEMVDTIIGRMPNKSPREMMNDPEMIKEMIGWAAGGPGMKVAAEAAPLAKAGIAKAWEYTHPEKAAEKMRSTLGEGTSSENIENLGKRFQLGKESARSEALIPKKKLFNEYGEERLVEEPSLSKYLSDEKVSDYYGTKGILKQKHELYAQEPTLGNYDALQSELKKQIRPLARREKAGTIGDVAEAKLNRLRENIDNLEEDVSGFVKKLPDEFQKLEKEWRTKYAQGVGKYEEAPLAIRKLAEGKWSEVTPEAVGKAFTRMTPETKKILLDVGPSAGKNILYNALQKVQPGDAGEMAKTILDLKRTKGYDQFITKEMEEWAYKMQKQVKNADLIKDALKLGTGSAAGGLVGGPIGAVVGAALPFVKEGAIKIAKKFKK